MKVASRVTGLFVTGVLCLGAVPARATENVLRFSGNGYVNTSHKFTGLSSATLEAWIRTGTVPAANSYGAIAGNGFLGNDTGFGLFAHNNGSLVFQTRQGGNNISALADYSFDGQWHHVAGVRDASAQATILYLDGEEVNRVSGNLDFSAISQVFGIGARYSSGWDFGFTGDIAEVRLWDHARTADRDTNRDEQPLDWGGVRSARLLAAERGGRNSRL